MNKKQPDHLNLLFDMGELASIITSGSDIEAFLTGAAELVAKHLQAHVCSIYLFDTRSKVLVLKATRGLKPEAVNRVRIAARRRVGRAMLLPGSDSAGGKRKNKPGV